MEKKNGVTPGRPQGRARGRCRAPQGQVEVARRARRGFAKGQHPAGLNYGDCFAYAPAKNRRLPLLHQGDDFPQTDVEGVLLAPVTI
jgi:uncharacterized protein with PIN domain